MAEQEKILTEKESLALITQMINKAKDSFYDTGLSSILWGCVIAFCSLERLAEIQFGYNLPFSIYWLTLVAIIPQIFISIKENKEKKAKSYDGALIGNLWFAFGISILLMMFVVNSVFAAWKPVLNEYQQLAAHPSAFRFSEFVLPFFLILYGIPTFVTGIACRFKPMIMGGILCWVCCVIAIYTTIKIDLLLTAFSAVCAWLIPGIIIRGEYRKAKQELKQVNV
jgi:hypothetical protein